MKHNIMKVPAVVCRKLLEFGDNDVVAACTCQFNADDVSKGALLRYGINVSNTGITVGLKGNFEPAANAGRFSRRNCHKTIIIHKGEPRVPRELEGVATDWQGGHHTFTYTRFCYPRSVDTPKHIRIEVQIVRVELDRIVVAFRVNESLNRTMPEFDRRLLAGLNLLQENVGTCNIELAATEMCQYQHVLSVHWKIFPPGVLTGAELAFRFFGKSVSRLGEKSIKEIQDRYDYLMSLGAKNIIVGIDSFQGYIGAMFEGDIVVFDNIRFGNAVYILREDWETLSKRTKRELRTMKGISHWVPHVNGWKQSVARILKMLRKELANGGGKNTNASYCGGNSPSL